MVNKLLWLVEGADDRAVFDAILKRANLLGCRQLQPFEWDIMANPSEKERADLARRHARDYEFILLVSDKKASRPQKHQRWARTKLQGYLNRELHKRSLNKHRAFWLVIDPELEIWLWQDIGALATCLNLNPASLQGQMAQLPWQTDPKQVLHDLANSAGQRMDAQMKGRIAEVTNLQQWLSDPAFKNLRKILRRWFK